MSDNPLLYLSGPMRGYPGFNYSMFHATAAVLRGLGFRVLNPAETAGGITDLPREKYLEIDVGYVMASDAIVLLPGWHESKGAKLEAMLGWECGKSLFLYLPDQQSALAPVYRLDFDVSAGAIGP